MCYATLSLSVSIGNANVQPHLEHVRRDYTRVHTHTVKVVLVKWTGAGGGGAEKSTPQLKHSSLVLYTLDCAACFS